MFAVFYRNVFQDWWHNQPGDRSWITRMIRAMSYERSDVDVIRYVSLPPAGSRFHFNEEKQIVVLREVTASVLQEKASEDEPDQFQDVVVHEVDHVMKGEFFLKQGIKIEESGNEDG